MNVKSPLCQEIPHFARSFVEKAVLCSGLDSTHEWKMHRLPVRPFCLLIFGYAYYSYVHSSGTVRTTVGKGGGGKWGVNNGSMQQAA